MITFQKLLAELTAFWQERGCLIHQGYDLEMGAGTFNPATFLRSLGPEPYSTAYVEPSRRPSDGRYGKNPNRIQLFHQFQVLIKPSPDNIQELYLESLKALGLDLKKHDIRFVHDDWESPTLGAWGLGWEVWCDGMEISQFTYFQAVGSLPLHPISVEITYGVERLLLYLQNKKSFFEMKWNDALTFQDVIHQSEVEWSHYNFTQANTAMWLSHFADFEKEANALIAAQLPLPAYDFVIKASHAFNLLDARGAISVSERAHYIGRIRELARKVAVSYVAIRETLGFPLLFQKIKSKPAKSKTFKPPSFNIHRSQDFLLEIGSEELPASFVPIGIAQIEKKVRSLLNEHLLSFEKLEVFGTPRRLAVVISGLVEGQPTTLQTRKGPSVSAAFTAEGIATPQGVGFLKNHFPVLPTLPEIREGRIPSLSIEQVKGVDYLFLNLEIPGKSTCAILYDHLPSLILNLEFPKKMRWGSGEISYARPLRWLIALFGTRVIPIALGNLIAHRYSYGHAQKSRDRVVIQHPSDYLKVLRKAHVIASVEERKAHILKQLTLLERQTRTQAVNLEQVMEEVLYLSEEPTLTLGKFDPSFLEAPKEILISEMVEHQRYFPLQTRSGKLKNSFIITADNQSTPLIIQGNEKVLSARLSDGVFLYNQDLATPLSHLLEKLKTMTFLAGSGTMYDKSERLGKIAHQIQKALHLEENLSISRAASLCKADLGSLIVYEFPHLQGTMGQYLARAQGEDPAICTAILEHWMPKAEGAPLPKTSLGALLSVADKLDNLITCFSLGYKPSSSSDPHALRRQAIGIIRILIEKAISISLIDLILDVSTCFPWIIESARAPLAQEIGTFIISRLRGVLEEYGFRKEEIESGLGVHVYQEKFKKQLLSEDKTHASITNFINPYDLFCRIQALHTFKLSGNEFFQLLEVYKRAKGQLTYVPKVPFNPELCQETAEKQLLLHLEHVQKLWPQHLDAKTYTSAFHLMATFQKPLSNLFENVKILSEDLSLRDNRISLLHKVFQYFDQLVDFGKL